MRSQAADHSTDQIEIQHLRSLVKQAEEKSRRFEILTTSLKSLALLLESKDALISHLHNCDHCISGQQSWFCETATAFLTDHDRLARKTEEAVEILKEQTDDEPEPLDLPSQT